MKRAKHNTHSSHLALKPPSIHIAHFFLSSFSFIFRCVVFFAIHSTQYSRAFERVYIFYCWDCIFLYCTLISCGFSATCVFVRLFFHHLCLFFTYLCLKSYLIHDDRALLPVWVTWTAMLRLLLLLRQQPRGNDCNVGISLPWILLSSLLHSSLYLRLVLCNLLLYLFSLLCMYAIATDFMKMTRLSIVSSMLKNERS